MGADGRRIVVVKEEELAVEEEQVEYENEEIILSYMVSRERKQALSWHC